MRFDLSFKERGDEENCGNRKLGANHITNPIDVKQFHL